MQLADRKHPHRLHEEVYQTHRTPIFVTVPTKDTRPALVPQLAPILKAVLFDKADRFGIALHAYCIMPDHVHIVCSVVSDQGDFEKFITTFKREVSRQAHSQGHADFRWQRSYWDEHARRENDVREMIKYVLANPVRRGLCDNWEEWPWSEFVSWPYAPEV